jgi:hypothetical protein
VKLHEIRYLTGEKYLNSPVFKSFGQIKKLFGPTQLATYYFGIKKDRIKQKYDYLPDSLTAQF